MAEVAGMLTFRPTFLHGLLALNIVLNIAVLIAVISDARPTQALPAASGGLTSVP